MLTLYCEAVTFSHYVTRDIHQCSPDGYAPVSHPYSVAVTFLADIHLSTGTLTIVIRVPRDLRH